MSQGVPHHTCTVHTPCQETPIAVAQPKSSDLPFKLFGTTIPVSDATLIISADQNSDRETNDESSRPPEDYNQVDEQGASFESSDGCEAKNSDKYLEEMEGKESRKAKRSSSVVTTDKMMPKKPDKLLPCPRCDSLETKFCYYNNYNVNQPRHFCKNCQRYWTAGGTLRNVPVGAGRRKNKHSTTLSHGTPFPNDINSDNPVQPNNSCFSIPIAMNHVHTDLSSSVISFGLDHNNTTYPTNGSEVLYKSPDRISGSPSKISTSGTSTSSPSSPWPNVCNGRWNSGNASWGTTLGKHPRYTQQPERSVLVPRTLRINDAKEASESSIWKSLRVEAKSDSFSSTGVFKAFQSKRIESTDSKHIYANSSSVQSINANPAAHTRSMSYQESS